MVFWGFFWRKFYDFVNFLGDMYQRGQSGPGIAPSVTGPTGNMPPTGVTNSASKTGSDYSGYGTGYGKIFFFLLNRWR